MRCAHNSVLLPARARARLRHLLTACVCRYGFYKVNKTPRGHRNAVDTQVWEFSHPKFIRGRPDLLDEIRRKALDSEHARVEARDLQYSVSVGQMQLRAQVDDVQFRLEECLEVNVGLRNALVGMREVLGGVLEWIKGQNGGQMPYELRMLQADIPIPSPMMPNWSETPWGAPPPGGQTPHVDGPPIFVTEPPFMGQSGPGGPPGPHAQGMQSGGSSHDYDPFAMGAMQHVSPLGSRRPSVASGAQSPMLDAQGRPVSAGRSPSFGEQGTFAGQQPNFSVHGRPMAGKPPPLSGLAIDTSAMSAHSSPAMQQHMQMMGAPNPGLGVMSIPPSPISPGVVQMMAAMNTPLPPSPAVSTAHQNSFLLDPHAAGNGSPYVGSPSNGFPGAGQFGQGQPSAFANAYTQQHAGDVFVGAGPVDDEMLNPNSKSLRTPLKRTASGSRERPQLQQHEQMQMQQQQAQMQQQQAQHQAQQQHQQQMQQQMQQGAQGMPMPGSPGGVMKRKSPT
jgi:hypothetical protein